MRNFSPVYIALVVLVQLAVCCLGIRPAAAADAASVAIQSALPDKFHDALRYRRVSATQYPDGRRTAREYLATVEIALHGRRDGATRLSWKYTHMTLNGEALADLDLELSVSPEGEVDLVNIDSLQRKVLEAASRKAKSAKPLEFGGDALTKMAENKQALAAFYLRDARMLFYPLGTTVRRDHAVELDGEIQGVGDDTLKVVDRWTVLADSEVPAATMAIDWKQEADRKDVERYFSALGKMMGIKLDADKGELTTKGLYLLDRKTFWPHEMVTSTKVRAQSNYEQFDSIEMRSSLLDPNWKH